jgi:hypothetical protein
VFNKRSVKTFLSMACCTVNPKVYTQYPRNKPAMVAAVTRKPGFMKRVVRMKPKKAGSAIKPTITARFPIMVKETTDPVLDLVILPPNGGQEGIKVVDVSDDSEIAIRHRTYEPFPIMGKGMGPECLLALYLLRQ